MCVCVYLFIIYVYIAIRPKCVNQNICFKRFIYATVYV